MVAHGSTPVVHAPGGTVLAFDFGAKRIGVAVGDLALRIAHIALAGPARQAAALKITNAHLVATCVDGKPVPSATRQWDVTAPVSLTLTMRNEPRPGIANAAPGLAVITFTPEAGHKYEIEVQAVATANSRRVWPQGKWAPAVRDRTGDRYVGSEPRWIDSGCGAP